MYLFKNKKTGQIVKFSTKQNKDWEEVTSSEGTSLKKDELKNKLILIRKRKLASTDWYASRFIKRGIEIPIEIIEQDKIMAQEIKEIENCTTLKQLEKYNINF